MAATWVNVVGPPGTYVDSNDSPVAVEKILITPTQVTTDGVVIVLASPLVCSSDDTGQLIGPDGTPGINWVASDTVSPPGQAMHITREPGVPAVGRFLQVVSANAPTVDIAALPQISAPGAPTYQTASNLTLSTVTAIINAANQVEATRAEGVESSLNVAVTAEAHRAQLAETANMAAIAAINAVINLPEIDQAILSNDPVMFFPLNDAAGSTTVDNEVAGGVNGIPNSGVALGAPGVFGLPDTAASFNGTTGCVSGPALSSILPAGSPVTFMAIVNNQGRAWPATYAPLLSASAMPGYIAALNGRAYVNAGQSTATGQAIPNTGWHVVFGWMDGAGNVGVSVDSGPDTLATAAKATSIFGTPQVGTGFGYFMGGLIARAAVFPTILSKSQRLSIAKNIYINNESTSICTTSQTLTAPVGTQYAVIFGKGGGGGPGGSGTCNTAVLQQPGGAAGNGNIANIIVPVNAGDSFTVIIGAGGQPGAPGAVGGSNGAAGTAGGNTTVTQNGNLILSATGGGPGQASPANSTALSPTGLCGYQGNDPGTVPAQPGQGAQPNQVAGMAQSDGWIAPWGAGTATATNGGGPGGAPQTPGLNNIHAVAGASPNANGMNATAAPAPNSGVGGPPGGAPANGGTAGTGLAGAAGQAVVQWRSA